MPTLDTTLFDLRGRVALVTGGARHLGFRMASTLARFGASVAVTSRNRESAERAAKDIADSTGSKTLGVALDVRDEDALEKAAALIAAHLGDPDILVNNVGGTIGETPRHLFERSPNDIRAMLEINLTGPILCTRQFAPAMARRGWGKVINISSVAAHVGRDRSVYEKSGLAAQPVEYAAAKCGLVGFTRDCAALLGRDGVRVNSISPGGFERSGMPDIFRKLYSDRTALGRMGDEPGSDLDGAVVFLASTASDYITGHDLVVDGGFSFWK